MDDCDEALQRLAVRLNELCQEGEAMTVGQMDGFVTGLLVCAQIVPPSEWLPVVWGPETEFESIEEAEATVAALIGHYNGVARTLAYEPENYGPVLEVDEITDEVFWIEWIRGFESAMGLRPETWEQIERNDEQDVTEAVEGDPHLVRGSERDVRIGGQGAGPAGGHGADADRRDGARSRCAQAIARARRGRTARTGPAGSSRGEGGARRVVRLRIGAAIRSLLRRALRIGQGSGAVTPVAAPGRRADTGRSIQSEPGYDFLRAGLEFFGNHASNRRRMSGSSKSAES